MKKTILSLLILCSFICQGQKDSDGGGISLLPMDTLHLLSDTNDSVEVLHHGTFKARDSVAYYFPVLADSGYSIHDFWSKKPDTLPCIMLICDTSFTICDTLNAYTAYTSSDNRIMIYPKSTSNPLVYWMRGYYISNSTPYLIYLDADKQPLSKNIIVWISKGIN